VTHVANVGEDAMTAKAREQEHIRKMKTLALLAFFGIEIE
jgi:hypothetical protein